MPARNVQFPDISATEKAFQINISRLADFVCPSGVFVRCCSGPTLASSHAGSCTASWGRLGRVGTTNLAVSASPTPVAIEEPPSWTSHRARAVSIVSRGEGGSKDLISPIQIFFS